MTARNPGKIVLLHPDAAPAPAPPSLSDEALLAACAVGATSALGILFDRHHASVHRFLARLSLTRAQDVDDLLQTTFLEVWRSPRGYRHKGSVKSWIFGIAVNVARRHLRCEMRRQKVLQDFAGVACARGDGTSATDVAAGRRQLLAALAKAVAALPYEQRVAFILCDLEGLAGVEAAAALGVRQGTMWRRLHDARKALRAGLEGGEW